ncbi:hypothetical protein CO038_02815 [Candidatus Pacearchaeota archaeon CG_4_9_14_0_2_um_filter_39_13]|nr:hypothetical protein [Candidatus Pacearchaeota archaeon]OIO42864.1 MAG: hypothetical protein AUJ64_03440 [Candidatus Pacearchaeota archaeon CG1_02_39_14]PJC44619.1 MAG: hypothetical protein CO038_02815 [Candidatus Pacearchaeota archaeon CG_4_9_14_0_2_um_filter_39_13]
MKKKLKWQFWLGTAILAILALAYLIKVPLESGASYTVNTRILSLLIFYNPIVLSAYIIIALILIIIGINRIKIE